MKQSLEQKEKYKKIICDIAKAFDAFCNKHNLRYFGIGGTAIGALRHKGLIPWDDDIDFVMPRPDYERFLKIAEELKPKYEVFTHRNTPKYHLTMAKMCDANTSYIATFRQHVITGAFIDIFPIDGCPGDTAEERKAFFNEYLELRHRGEAICTYYSVRDFIASIYRKDWSDIQYQLYSHWYHLIGKSNDIFAKCDKIITETPFDTSQYVAYFSTWRGPKVISPREWFDDYYYAPFEDFQIRLPKGIHHYLTQVYGDYMTPPPQSVIEQDYHGCAYFNLDKRLSWDEVFKEYKKNKD